MSRWLPTTLLVLALAQATDAQTLRRRQDRGPAPVGGIGSLVGEWEPPLAWPLRAAHASLLPGGSILTLADGEGPRAEARGRQSAGAFAATAEPPFAPLAGPGATRADLADVATWSHERVDPPQGLLVGAAHARLSDGSLLFFGGYAGDDGTGTPRGRDAATRFDATTKSWIPVPDLAQRRFGPSAVTLGNGDVLALGGGHAGANLHRPELFDGCSWRTLDDVDTSGWWENLDAFDDVYPFVHAASDGRLFVSGWDEDMAFVDVRGAGTIENVVQRESIQRLWGSAVVYDEDRALLIGGVDHQGDFGPALATCRTVDFSNVWPSSGATGSMSFARADANAVVLADGTVFVHGGGAFHGARRHVHLVQASELWDPDTGLWSTAAASAHARGERSTALLLPDGRVWTAGGECVAGCPGGRTAEVYRPPYLFVGGTSTLAPRPVIADAPSTIAYDASFDVTMESDDVVSRVTLVRFGSTTAGVDFEQRFLEPTFLQAGAVLTIDAPSNGYVAPPGWYHLFAFDASGVPSVAATVRLAPDSPSGWTSLTASNGSIPQPRHETAMVHAGGRYYLIGGRGSRPVQEYDPVERIWRTRAHPPMQIHHFQPVVLDGLVYVVGAFVGDYPSETPIATMLIYDPADDSWTTGPAMPAGRNRGSAGAVVYDGKIYFVGGNTMGHDGGYVPWLDVYDPVAGTWTALPDAPHARDHFLAAVVGNKLVAAGGRTTDQPNPFDGTVAAVDVYDVAAGTWTTSPHPIPTERAGTMTVPIGPFVVVAGGESNSMTDAHDEVEAYDVLMDEWHVLPSLVGERHSGGVAVHDGRIFVAAGAGNRGGGPELATFEDLDAAALLEGLSTNPLANAGFDAGLAGWTTAGDVRLSSLGGVKSPSLRARGGEASQTVAAAAGTTYSLFALYRLRPGLGGATLALEFLNAAEGVLATHSLALTTTSELTSASVSGTAPGGTVSLRARVVSAAPRVLEIDDLAVREL